MEVTSILSLLQDMPEGITLVIVTVVLLVSLFLKKKDVDLTQVTSISKLQSAQLTQLIEQNVALAKEMRLVRQELSDAYKVIDDMRERVTELEEMLRSRGHVTDFQEGI